MSRWPTTLPWLGPALLLHAALVLAIALRWSAPPERAPRVELPIELEREAEPVTQRSPPSAPRERAVASGLAEGSGATQKASFAAKPSTQQSAPAPDAFALAQAANARLTIQFEQLREHALGRVVARLLERRGALADLTQAGLLEPARDFDRVVMAGSNLELGTTIVQYGAPRYKLRNAARHVQTEARLAVLAAREILIIAPAGARAAIARLPHHFRLPDTTHALELQLKGPALSERFATAGGLRSLTIRLELLEGAAARLQVLAKSSSAPQLAAAFAPTPHLRDVQLSVEGSAISGEATLDASADIEGLLAALLP